MGVIVGLIEAGQGESTSESGRSVLSIPFLAGRVRAVSSSSFSITHRTSSNRGVDNPSPLSGGRDGLEKLLVRIFVFVAGE